MNEVSTPYLWQLGAQLMAKGIRDRDFSSKEVVESCLQRIEQTNPLINAMNEVRPGAALAAAELADKAVATGEELGLLHGVPVWIVWRQRKLMKNKLDYNANRSTLTR